MKFNLQDDCRSVLESFKGKELDVPAIKAALTNVIDKHLEEVLKTAGPLFDLEVTAGEDPAYPKFFLNLNVNHPLAPYLAGEMAEE